MMKQNYYVHAFLISVIFISLIFTYHFFMKTIDSELPINENESAVEKNFHFVLIVQEFENQYLQELFQGAEASGQNNGSTIEYWGTKQTNINDHIKLIEMAIASKVDGILTQGLSNEFLPVIEKAYENGIPVIIVDSDFDNNDLFTYVGTNNYQAGYKIGLTVLDETEGQTKIGILTGSLIPNNMKERVQGFLDAISNEDRMEVVSIESSNLSKIQGAEKTYRMLREHPDISIFFGTSAFDSLGITAGIKKVKPSRNITIYGFDDLDENVELMKNGEIHAILKQEPYEMGFVGVNLLVDLIEGQKIKKEYYTTTTILKKEDVKNETR